MQPQPMEQRTVGLSGKILTTIHVTGNIHVGVGKGMDVSGVGMYIAE